MTRLIDAVKYALTVQSGHINCKIELPSLEQGIVPFLNQFGQLYHGHFTPDEFATIYNTKKHRFINDLVDINLIDNIDKRQAMGFWLFMCRVAQTSSWQWPGLVTRMHSELHIETGNSRFLATGLCKSNPSQQISFLVLEDVDTEPDYLTSPEKITTDEQLHKILGQLPAKDDSVGAHVRLWVKLITDGNKPRIFLQHVDEGSKYIHRDAGQDELSNYINWSQRYGTQPVLNVYTDRPDLVKNTGNFWKINYAGPIPFPTHVITKPGHLENHIRQFVENNNSLNEHSLFILYPVAIDAGEFAFWITLNHTTFLDTDYQFALYRKDSEFSTTLVTLSEITVEPE